MADGNGPLEPGGGGYEFTEPQNQEIGALASAVTFVGTLLLVGGVIQILSGVGSLFGKQFGPALGYVIQGVLNIMLGTWTRGAGASFDNIVKTQGNDIGNLMVAVRDLKNVYSLQRILIIIGLVIGILAVVLGVTVPVLSAMSGVPTKP